MLIVDTFYTICCGLRIHCGAHAAHFKPAATWTSGRSLRGTKMSFVSISLEIFNLVLKS